MPEISASKYVVQAHRDIWHRPERKKKCVRCGESKPLGEFYVYGYTTRQSKPGTRYESRCKPCAQERRREDYIKHARREEKNRRDWRRRNVDHVKRYNEERQKLDEVKARKALNQRLRKARMRAQAGDNAEIRAIYAEAMRIQKIIACCPVFDLPELGKKMHVDHVRPLARGGKHEASNLQILPIGINMRKGTKCPR
jgi:hypothetical protein